MSEQRLKVEAEILKRIDEIRPSNPKKSDYTHGIDVGLAMAKVAIKDAPTIEERKTGKWERHNTYHGDDVSGFVDPDWRCSECGGQANVNAWCMYDLTDFCPNCGADMRGEKMANNEEYCKDCDRSIYGKYHDCDVNIENDGKYVMSDKRCYCKIVNGKRAEKYPWEGEDNGFE